MAEVRHDRRRTNYRSSQLNHSTLPAELKGSVKERRARRGYSPSSETLHAIDSIIKMLIASRRLHLATIHDPDSSGAKRKSYRDALLNAAKEQVNIAVHLGSMGQLSTCDSCESHARVSISLMTSTWISAVTGG